MSRRLVLLGHYPPSLVLEKTQRLMDAVVAMDERGVRHAVIVDEEGRLEGILSVRRVLGELLRGYEEGNLYKRLTETTLGSVMRRDPPSFVVGEFGVEEVVETMARLDIGAVVVTDKERHVLGIISEKHIAGIMALTSINAAVHEIMSSPVHSVKRSDSVEQVIRLMSEHRHRHAPVVDEEGRLEAIVSARDVLGLVAAEESLELIRKGEAEKVMRTSVERIAVGEPATVQPGADVSTALRTMRKHGISAVPVVNAEGKVVGIVTERDIVVKLPRLMGVEMFYDLSRSRLYVARVVA